MGFVDKEWLDLCKDGVRGSPWYLISGVHWGFRVSRSPRSIEVSSYGFRIGNVEYTY